MLQFIILIALVLIMIYVNTVVALYFYISVMKKKDSTLCKKMLVQIILYVMRTGAENIYEYCILYKIITGIYFSFKNTKKD